MLKEILSAECVDLCNGKLLVFAKQMLRQNNVNIYVYAAAVGAAIIAGRQKNNNMMLAG